MYTSTMTTGICAAGRVGDSRKVCVRLVHNHFQLDEVAFEEESRLGRAFSGDRVSRLHYLSALQRVFTTVFLNFSNLLVVSS